jgi:hypothetical protein
VDIILDANALIADFTLASPAFRLLFDGVARLDAKLYVVDVSVAEAARKLREELTTLTGTADRLQRISGRPLDLTAFAALDEVVSEYKARVAEKFIVLPTPAVPHMRVVDRILAGRSPSRGGDRGYRDTLIWETVLERFGAHRGKVLLVTGDGDFSDKSGRPHADLLTDLNERGVEHERLTIFKAVAHLNKERIEPNLKAVEKYQGMLKDDAFPDFSLRDWFLEEIPQHATKLVGGRARYRTSRSDVSLDDFEIDEIDVTEVKGLEDGDIYLQAEASFDARFRVSADLLDDDDDGEEDRYRDALHEPSWREREVRRKGHFLAYAELILQTDGEVVSADLYGIDKLA